MYLTILVYYSKLIFLVISLFRVLVLLLDPIFKRNKAVRMEIIPIKMKGAFPFKTNTAEPINGPII